MKYEAVLFDMDGTVLDTLDDLVNAANYTLHHFGFPEMSRKQIRARLGNGAAFLIKSCLPEGTDLERQEEIVRFYKHY